MVPVAAEVAEVDHTAKVAAEARAAAVKVAEAVVVSGATYSVAEAVKDPSPCRRLTQSQIKGFLPPHIIDRQLSRHHHLHTIRIIFTR